MADYRPETCAYCQADTWCEIRANGKPQCRACKVERFFAEILYPPLGYRLLAWQRKVLRDIYGTVSPEDGRRRYRSGYISVGKKNGKALGLDTPIPTPGGWKKMRELCVADRVFDEQGVPCSVVAVSPVYVDHDCYRLTFSNRDRVVADAGHEWFVSSSAEQDAVAKTTEHLARTVDGARNYFIRMHGRSDRTVQIRSVEKVEPVPVRCIQVDSPRHMYLCGKTMLPTHNSFLIGGLPLYHLLMEEERNPEAYGAAAAKDQAAIVYKAAAQLVAANPHLQARLKVLPSTKRILRRDGGGFYAVLSADGDLQDGIEPSLVIRDEVHRWKTLRAETLHDVITKGQISREQPLDIGISTAGAEYESQLWWREYQQAKKVLDGSLHSDTFYAAIWEADVNRMESDPEYWKSREARIAANPSHEDLGGFLKDSAIVGELEKALAQPSERSKYLRYHLNVPLKTNEDPVIDMAKWQQCGGGIDLREWPEYDVELLIRKWGLRDKPCWAGVDASWTTDLTAVVFVFPPFDGGEVWTLLAFFFMPAERVSELERVCRVPYSTWIRQGFIEVTPGNGIDMRAVKRRIHWGRELFDLREMPFDRFNFRTQAMELLDEGIQAVEITQSFLHLSHPTKFLLSAYVDQKIRHGNSPALNWMASCLQLQYDRKDNCQPSKPERGKSAKRIDGIAATVTALARATVAQESTITYTGLCSVG